MRKYLEEERVTTALLAVGWTWLALAVVLYIFMIYSTWRWGGPASLVAAFEQSGADIALGAAELVAPGVLAILVAYVLKARRTRT
jgi:hypothetical protein